MGRLIALAAVVCGLVPVGCWTESGEADAARPPDVCQPDCGGKECGDDGCGGICGECSEGLSCEANHCGPPFHVWSKSFGSPDLSESPAHMVLDGSGNIYVAVGSDSDALDFGVGAHQNTGEWDTFLVKLDPAGEPTWSRQIGGKDDEWSDSLVVDKAGNICLVGHSWSKKIRFGLEGTEVTVDQASTCCGFFAAYSPSGELAYARGLDFSPGVAAIDAAGNLVVAGVSGDDGEPMCIRQVSPDGDALEPSCVPGYRGERIWGFEPSPGGGFVILATAGQSAPGRYLDYRPKLMKFDPEKGVAWSTGFGEECLTGEYSMDVDAQGSAYVIGLFEDAVVAPDQPPDEDDWEEEWGEYLLKVDAQGDIAWAFELFDSDGEGEVTDSVCSDGAGNVLVGGTGYFGEMPPDYEDSSNQAVFVLKVDSDGKLVWARNFAGDFAYADRLAVDHAQGIYLTGSFTSFMSLGTGATSGGLDFGGGILPRYGHYDMFLVKFAE